MSATIPDQVPVWDAKHAHRDHSMLQGVPSPLAELSISDFPPHSNILELGCGVGRDAVFFAEHGHKVLATDGSRIVIDQDKQELAQSSVKFDVLDMRQTFPYATGTFDVVYANLSLHYYSHEQTTSIIKEIVRVLKDGGVFAFGCKSFDSQHNTGKEIEPDVYVSSSGAAVHLFSKEYATSLLTDLFQITHLDGVEEEYNGRHSRIVRCIATKLAPLSSEG